MEIEFTKQDVLGFLKLVPSTNSSLSQGIGMFDSCVSFNNAICIKKNLPIGSISMQLAVAAVDGCAEINIKSVQLFGSNWFGIIRQKAGDLILGFLKPYSSTLKSWKNKKGNIQIQVNHVAITTLAITGDQISLIAEFN